MMDALMGTLCAGLIIASLSAACAFALRLCVSAEREMTGAGLAASQLELRLESRALTTQATSILMGGVIYDVALSGRTTNDGTVDEVVEVSWTGTIGDDRVCMESQTR